MNPSSLFVRERDEGRMMLREAGAMKPMEASPCQAVDTWAKKVGQRTQDDLPTDLKIQHVPRSTATALCCLDQSAVECVDCVPVRISRTLCPSSLWLGREPTHYEAGYRCNTERHYENC